MPVKTKTRVPESMGVSGDLVDARAKQVLREAVDAVVNSFAKHTQGYGRGKIFKYILLYSSLLTSNNFLIFFQNNKL